MYGREKRIHYFQMLSNIRHAARKSRSSRPGTMTPRSYYMSQRSIASQVCTSYILMYVPVTVSISAECQTPLLRYFMSLEPRGPPFMNASLLRYLQTPCHTCRNYPTAGYIPLFRPSATVSRIGLMESRLCRHCRGGPPHHHHRPPQHGGPPPQPGLGTWARGGAGGRYAG